MFRFLTERPYFQLLLLLSAGIAVGAGASLPLQVISGLLALLAACVAVGLLRLRQFGDTRLLYAGFGLLVILFGIGSARLAVAGPLRSPLRQLTSSEPRWVEGRISSIPKYQKGHLRFLLDIDEVSVTDKTALTRTRYHAPGRCFMFVKCEQPPEIYYNDRIRLLTSIEEEDPPGNRGQFDYRGYLLRRGTVLTGYCAFPDTLRRERMGRPQPWAAITHLRSRLLAALAHQQDPYLGQLAVSVVYGDKITDLDPALEDRFRRAGLTHILVASGTQVSLLIGLLALAFWRRGDSSTLRGLLTSHGQFWATLTLVFIYAAVTGLETSIVRALTMGGIVLLGRLVSREADGLTALSQAGLALLLVSPLELLAPGFQLSFGATFGLMYLAGVLFPLLAHLAGFRLLALQALITTAGAQLFVTPILITTFHQLSAWGLISNLLAVPLSFALLVCGGIGSLGLVYLPVIGEGFRWIVYALAFSLDWIARVFSSLPASSLAVPQPPWLWTLGYFALLLLAGEMIKNRDLLGTAAALRMRLAIASLTLLLAAPVLWWAIVPRPEFTALALPGCEGYLWRPRTGRTILLLRAAGLQRRHNAETVESALRCRGINTVHAVVWLEGAPPAEPLLPAYDCTALTPGVQLDAAFDMGWLSLEGDTYGARLDLGGRRIDIVWERPYLLLRQQSSAERATDLLVLGPRANAALKGRQATVIRELAGRVLAYGEVNEDPLTASLPMANCELTVRPHGNGISLALGVSTDQLQAGD